MTRAELLALAERVERAMGADAIRALEVEIDEIALELGWRAERKEAPFDAPVYLRSLDAPPALMPNEYRYRWRVTAWGTADIDDYRWEGSADAPAAALTAAAIRARAEEAGE